MAPARRRPPSSPRFKVSARSRGPAAPLNNGEQTTGFETFDSEVPTARFKLAVIRGFVWHVVLTLI